MICIFNRREVYFTYDMGKQAKVRDVLSANGIDYRVKVFNAGSSNNFGRSRRSRHGSFGTDANFTYQYKIYVHKRDYDKASYLVREV